MKTLYEPSNALEAQILHDLLQQEGIETRINGAYLQGGVGELQASGLVRLVMEDEDYEQARTIIKRWEATEVPTGEPAVAKPPTKALTAALGGLLLGVVGTYSFFHIPINVDGNDYNYDGVLDERWRYSASGAFLGSTVDRNLDRKVDYQSQTNQKGEAVSAEADDDFDGIFETKIQIKNGSFEYIEVDTDGDALPNLKTYYKYGVAVSTEYINPLSGLPARVEHYRLGALTTAEVDTDNDGKLDKRYTYSNTAQITHEENIQQ